MKTRILHFLKSKRSRRIYLGLFAIAAVAYWFCLPKTLFNDPLSLVVNSQEGVLLGATIAKDGQWRFPEAKEAVPEKFAQSLIAFEDKRFLSHPGFDPLALGRAVQQNITRGTTVSGASTISMQVIRLSRKDRPRNVWEKVVELVLSTRLELRYSKDEILKLYATHAPFGGNVVGLEAAAWRYYGKPANLLSWGEAATLAVLPNSPALVHPGRNRSSLEKKRNRLLNTLLTQKIIDSTTCALAKNEPLPGQPLPLPRLAPELLTRLQRQGTQGMVHSTVHADLQAGTRSLLRRHYPSLSANGVHNAAVLVMDVKTGEILVYAGNMPGLSSQEHGAALDLITAPRSPGSTLKPLLHAYMLQQGELLPRMLLPDVPTVLNTYTPKNYNETYNGAVRADEALARSLNIPAVHLLRDCTPGRFVEQLRRMGFTTVNHGANYYGLSLILGGVEVNLEDLTGVYASMARRLAQTEEKPKNVQGALSHFIYDSTRPAPRPAAGLDAGSIWLTFAALQQVARPDEEVYWRSFSGAQPIAWKTGTSFGNRDAWAVGCTPQYVVGVWVGNADGEGRPGLTGSASAAPILFDVFGMLPTSRKWFEKPEHSLQKMATCPQSGHPAGPHCPEQVMVDVSRTHYDAPPCPYHQQVALDESAVARVHSGCYPVYKMVQKSYFVLPPIMEKFYRTHHAEYQALPKWKDSCLTCSPAEPQMSMVYPQKSTKIYLPRTLASDRSSTLFEAAHHQPDATIFWHMDHQFLGTTSGQHQMPLSPPPGKHVLTLVDGTGNSLELPFEVL